MNALMQQLERAWGKTNLGDPGSVQIFLMCFDALWPQIVKSAVQPEAAARSPTYVWAVENKTSFAIFGTEEAARVYVSSFPASVGGGMTIAKLAVLDASLPQKDE